MNVFHLKTQHGIVLQSVEVGILRNAIKVHTLDGLQLSDGIFRERFFVDLDGIHADSRHIIERLGQSVGGDIVGGSGLKLQRGLLKCGAFKTNMGNHLAATLIRRQLL